MAYGPQYLNFFSEISMTTDFTLKIFTPAGLILEESVSSITLPSSKGEIGILSAHTSYAGLVGIGVLRYTSANGAQEKKLVVSGGFATFENDIFTVLADAVDLPDKLHAGISKEKPEDLRKIVETTSMFEPEWQIAADKLKRLESLQGLGH